VTAWTPEQDAELRRMCADGMTFAEMAMALGANRNAAIGRAHRRGYHNGREPGGGNRHRRPRPVAPPPEPPMPEPTPAEPVNPVHILDLPRYGACRWPLWNHTDQPSMMFCGAPVKDESVYCAEHHPRCHTPAASRRA